MAQVADITSVWAQAIVAQKPQGKESVVGTLTAKELSIVWGSDTRYWKWKSMVVPHSCTSIDVAELIEVCWLQVDGKYETKKLEGGRKYAVDFVVELKDNLCMNGPVKLKLTRPDGSVQEHKEDLSDKPKNKVIGLRIGEFMNELKCGCDHQHVKFSLNGNDGTTWKKGLVIIAAVIYPC